MGTHMRVLGKSFPMNTNMTGFGWLTKDLCILVLWMKKVLALEGLMSNVSLGLIDVLKFV